MQFTEDQNILRNLIHNEEYARSVFPFLKTEYFDSANSVIFETYSKFFSKYNNRPSVEAMVVEINNAGVHEKINEQCMELLEGIKHETTADDIEWLVDNTEKFCQNKALYNAMSKSISIMDGENKEGLVKTAIPDILSEALAVSFDSDVGHDYFEDAEKRYDMIHAKTHKYPFDIEALNKITKGGVEAKTLNVILAGTNVGKSLIMCHFAAADLSAGKNVLYITLEMAEEKIGQRIDANLLNISLDDIEAMPKALFMEKIAKVKAKTTGRLEVKEFPTSSAHAGHFRHLLRELSQKKKFKPDVIYIDYINICASSRLTLAKAGGTYLYVKSIAEEIRGLAGEFKVPIWSATQTNRSGFSDSDADMDSTSDSFGLPQTVDFMFLVVSNEQLDELGQYQFKQLKNRYADKSKMRRFIVGVDKSKQRLFDVRQEITEGVNNEPKQDSPLKSKLQKKGFEGINV